MTVRSQGIPRRKVDRLDGPLESVYVKHRGDLKTGLQPR